MRRLTVTFGVLLVILGKTSNSQRVAEIGSEIKPSASGVDFVNVTFLLDKAVPGNGVLFAFSAYFRSFAAVRLQIWRPVGNESHSLLYELISQVRVIPAGIYQREDVYIESKFTEKCTRVQKDDRLGMYVEEIPGSIAYTFLPTKASTLTATNPIEANATNSTGIRMLFDKLTFPYEFSLAAYIDTDMSNYENPDELHPECPKGLMIPQYGMLPQGTTGPSVVSGEPGDTGATGPVGDTGDTGEIGPIGPMGFTGATGPIGATGQRGFRGEVGLNGSDGQDGTAGATGFTGPRGKDGISGTPGSPGPPGPPGQVKTVTPDPKTLAQTQKDHALLDPKLILGILIWLVIVTILIILILLVLLWMFYKQKKSENKEEGKGKVKTVKNNSFLSVDGQNSMGNNNEDMWMQKMKEEVESQYKLDTIMDHPKQSNAGTLGKNIGDEKQNYKSNSGYGKLELYGDANDLSHRNSLRSNYRNSHQGGQQSFGAINSIYKNLDVPHYEVKNY